MNKPARPLRSLELIADVARTPTPEWKQGLRHLLVHFQAGLGADGVGLYEEEAGELVLRCSVGVETLEKVGQEGTLLGAALGQNRGVAVEDLSRDSRLRSGFKELGLRGFAAVPVSAPARPTGVLYAVWRSRLPVPPFASDDELLSLLRLTAGWTLNARELDELRRRSDQLAERLEAEKAIRENFVSRLSHDLRGPLAAIRSGAQLMMRYQDRAEMREKLLETFLESIDRTDQMLQDLLDVNQVFSGQTLVLTLEECDLEKELRQVIATFSAIHRERVELRMTEPVRGYWAAAPLRRSVRNLITNALRFGEIEKPVHLFVERLQDRVRIHVRNQGTALTPEEQATFFQPLRKTPKSGQKMSWGLGLVLVRGIIEAHGGNLQVRSAPEEGTTVILDLPVDARPYQSFLMHVS